MIHNTEQIAPLSSELYRKKSNYKQVIRRNVPLLIMFAPVLLYYILFRYLPISGLVIAFKEYNFTDGIWGSPWVGLKYFDLLFHSEQSLQIIRNTLVLGLLTIFVGFPFPILIAILLNEVRKLWFKKFVQTLVYLPHFLSWVIVGGLVTTIFSQQSGLANHVVELFAKESYPFLYNPNSWIVIFVSSGIWKEAGFSAIIYLAALTTIDPSLYEAASMDGASKSRQIWHITLPGISTTIALMLILSLGHVMEVGFDHVYVLKNDVVYNVAEVISTYSYRVGLQGMQFSLTGALGLFESVVGFIFIILANSIARMFNRNLW